MDEVPRGHHFRFGGGEDEAPAAEGGADLGDHGL